MNVHDLFGLAALMAVILGAGVLFLVYVLVQMKGNNAPDAVPAQQRPDKRKSQDKTKSSKQQQQQVKNRKLDNKHSQGHQQHPKQESFSHPWLLATLKGHTGEILHMDFASNGKYLSSCADEDPDPGGRRRRRRHQRLNSAVAAPSSSTDSTTEAINKSHNLSGSHSTSSSSSEDGSSTSTNNSPRSIKGLSRRQRKNCRKHTIVKMPTNKSSHNNNNNFLRNVNVSNNNTNSRIIVIKKQQSIAQPPFSGYRALVRDSNGNERRLLHQIMSYILPKEVLRAMGYPIRDIDIHYNHQKANCFNNYKGGVLGTVPPQVAPSMGARYFYNTNMKVLPTARCVYYHFYNNYYMLPAPPMVFPSSTVVATVAPISLTKYNVRAREFVPPDLTSSGASSNSSSSDESDIYSSFDVHSNSSGNSSGDEDDDVYLRRRCVRCNAGYITTRTDYVTKDSCTYHWGKCTRSSGDSERQFLYTCCNGRRGSRGCTTAQLHVSNNNSNNHDFSQYKWTGMRKPRGFGPSNIYALDCEMCFTVAGLECTKVTVVNLDGYIVYDSYVKPLNRIIDYNTRYSGISESDLDYAKSFSDVQADLLRIFDGTTILIGHGLENDLKALKIVHYAVVDTALCFLNSNGSRRSLKNLMWTYLEREVQTGSEGHDSYEDAVSCLELVCFRLRNDLKIAPVRNT